MLIIDSAEVILRHYAENFKHPRMRNLQSLNNTSYLQVSWVDISRILTLRKLVDKWGLFMTMVL